MESKGNSELKRRGEQIEDNKLEAGSASNISHILGRPGRAVTPWPRWRGGLLGPPKISLEVSPLG